MNREETKFVKKVLDLLDGNCFREGTYRGDWDYRDYVYVKEDKLVFEQHTNGARGDTLPDDIIIPESIKNALKELEELMDDD